MQVLENCSLKERHTFHMDVKTRYWVDYNSVEELREALSDPRFKGLQTFAVGGGSNLLFTADFTGLLLHSALKSIELIADEEDHVLLKVGSGVVWDDLVAFAVEKGWSGIENLSGIPGEVGASPVQNIGAYGSEAKDTIERVEAMNLETLQLQDFSNADCRFGYRDSIFKRELKNKFIVCYVTYRLSKVLNANIRYGEMAVRMEQKGELSLRAIRQTVLEIRADKLPDPALAGNAGSFFMNPEITAEQVEQLKQKWPEMPVWPLENGLVKVSAAWCIDQLGWKGRHLGGAAVHHKQALVLVNTGSARASEVMELASRIIADVKSCFGIELHPEVLYL